MNLDQINEIAMELSDYGLICDFLKRIPEKVLERYVNIDPDENDEDLFNCLEDAAHFGETDAFIRLVNDAITFDEV